MPTYTSQYDKSWALVVGINTYLHASPLSFARNDADVFARTLTDKFGFPKENVEVLLDNDATLTAIRRTMHKLSRTTSENDRVIVFYAGHGHTVQGPRRDSGFLVPVDGTPDDTSTLLPWDDLVNTAHLIPAKHILFIMDACYGGLIGVRGLAPGSKRFVRDMMSRYTRQFLAAGKPDQVVADGGGPRKGHSLFTGHLLEGLDGGLQATDGIISANPVMAYVYDRVTREPQSQQTPHYGFLTGDGDLFFTIPDVQNDPKQQKDTGDVLIEVPPDLVAPEEESPAKSTTEQLKRFLSEPRYRIDLDDLIVKSLRTTQQRLGEAQFPLQGNGISKEQFAERLQKYEDATQDLLRITMLLAKWAEEGQQVELKQIVNVLAGQIEVKGGLVVWLALRSYPMLLAMYTAGIAAIEGGNYASLKTLFTTEVTENRRDKTQPVVVATANAMLDVARSEAFKMLPGHENNYSPQSEYLYKRIQPMVEDLLFLGNRYEGLFDRFEILYALSYADATNDYWGHPGRFAWKYRHAISGNPFKTLVEEATRERQMWGPLKAGMFRGSIDRFIEVANRFRDELLHKLQWH